MKLTKREKYLMQQVWDHLQFNPMAPVEGSLDGWLEETGPHGDNGETITCAEYLAAAAPLGTEEGQQFLIFAGDMWDAGMDREAAVARAFELSRRIGVRTRARNPGDVEIGKWIYLVDANRVQSMELSPILVDVK